MEQSNNKSNEPRRIKPEEEIEFISQHLEGLQKHFLSETKMKWADAWNLPREEYANIVKTVLEMDADAITNLRAENRKKEPLPPVMEKQIQVLHSIDLFITGVLKLPEE